MTNPTPPVSEKPPEKQKETPQTPLPDNLEKPTSFYKYVSSNTRDTVAYVVLIVGIILLFLPSLYGAFDWNYRGTLIFRMRFVYIATSLNGTD